MKKNSLVTLSIALLTCTLFTGCGDKTTAQEASKETTVSASDMTSESEEIQSETGTDGNTDDAQTETTVEAEAETTQSELPDGVYTADFNTDSSMFHVSEACDGKGTLTVSDGSMTIHISLGSKKIINLYPGLAADAQKEGAVLLEPTVDTVTYSDGMTEEVYGFDVPVSALDEEFDLALIGTKGTWYDHKVSVSNPVASEEVKALPEDGTYTIELTFEGGSGKASIISPATVTITGDTAVATVEWDSPNYDYMLVDGEKSLPVNTEGNSVFEIPVTAWDEPMDIIGDTVAMSKPHEIEYTITFHSETMKLEE